MAVSPAALDFFYALGGTTPAGQTITVTTDPGDQSPPSNNWIEVEIDYAGSASGWLTVSHTGGNDYTAAVDPTGYQPGDYEATVNFIWMADDGSGAYELARSSNIVRMHVQDSDYLYPDPTGVQFTHELGATLPAPVSVAVHTNQSWTASSNHSAVSVSPASGSGSGSVDIALTSDADNLSAGSYTFTVTLTGGGLMAQIQVDVTIMDPSGFRVSPGSMEFSFRRGAGQPVAQTLHVFADADWQATAWPDWISLSQTSGNAGNVNVDVTPVNYQNFGAGVRTGVITITSGGVSYNVYVSLTVINYLDLNFQAMQTLYTREPYRIEINSDRTDTYFEINLSGHIFNYDGRAVPYLRRFRLPLFNGHGQFYPGLPVHQLADELTQFNTGHNRPAFVPVLSPATMDINLSEKQLDDNTEVFSGSIDGLRWIFGTKAYEFFMTEAAKRRIILGDSDVCFQNKGRDESLVLSNVTYGGSEQLDYTNVSGRWITQFHRYIDDDSGVVYRLSGSGAQIEFFVINGEHPVRLHFVNRWLVPDWLDFNAELRIDSSLEYQRQRINRYLWQSDRNAATRMKQEISFETGWIFAEEVAALHSAMRSPLTAIERANQDLIYVRPKVQKLLAHKPSERMYNYKLTFEIVENVDDQVYT